MSDSCKVLRLPLCLRIMTGVSGSLSESELHIEEERGRTAVAWTSDAGNLIEDEMFRRDFGEWQVGGPTFCAVDEETLPRCLFGVAALWPVTQGQGAEFWSAAIQNASKSVSDEKGCGYFAVVRDASSEDRFALIELFVERAAFELHLQADHFRQFANFANPIYVGRRSDTLKGRVRWPGRA